MGKIKKSYLELYREAANLLDALENNGQESDCLRDAMDLLWWRMTKAEIHEYLGQTDGQDLV